ncbi:MAG: ammonium transporter [Bacteroidetes bacterium]|nr:ammonium transporter [Bacteroidota bacterium]
MKKRSTALKMTLSLLFFGLASAVFAQGNIKTEVSSILEFQQYDRAIHIMAMLILGFGFLMVFVKNYGRSALTATFLLVSVAIPLYMAGSSLIHGDGSNKEIERLILAEFGAASLLIAAGALLGRIKMHQYIILGLLFIPCYMLNEWIILDNGLGLLKSGFADTGGSIVIHAFGAIFGIAAAISLTTSDSLEKPVTSDSSSDRFSMIGSMVLWIFWPSFCAALVPAEAIPMTVVNVFLALCGSTLVTYVLSVWIRGKISIADIANAALAGGVAIGATCDHANHMTALVIGLIAGAISATGFAVLQDRQKKLLKTVDTCGVTNLHGLPGLFGGLIAIPVVFGLSAVAQLTGIAITIVLAIGAGLISGKVISLFGQRKEVYSDVEEFVDAEAD